MDLYRDEILDHYKNPRNFGHLPHPQTQATMSNTTCGDVITMEVMLNEKEIVTDVRFSGVGCAISQASASMLTEEVVGKSKSFVLRLATNDILSLLHTQLTPSRIKCALLPLEVLQKSLTHSP